MAVKKVQKVVNRNAQIIDAVLTLAKEKDIDEGYIMNALEEGCKTAYKHNSHKDDVVSSSLICTITRENGIQIFARKIVAEEVEDSASQISYEEARRLSPNYQIGDIVQIDVTPRDFDRVAAQTAKQVIMQKLREAERGKIYDEYIDKENEIMTAIVQRVDSKAVYVELGRTEGVMEADQWMPGEEYHEGDHIKVYVLSVQKSGKDTGRTPQVYVSRIHSGLLKRLFEMEVPQIASGIVQVKFIAREAGSRTKMAVTSADPQIDPVGACVGPRGTRVDNVVKELKNEKIDIIKWSQDPAEFVANALNPAHVVSVFISDSEKICRVIVPDNQLSLAIGKEGQNARLAAKLTGWKIDIKSQTQVAELMGQELPQLQEGNGQVIADEYEADDYQPSKEDEDIL